MTPVPYSGAIEWCQASVHEEGRSVGFRRCIKRARYVIRRAHDPRGDGRLAVCGTHARPNVAFRWKYSYGPQGAFEPVEPEYQP